MVETGYIAIARTAIVNIMIVREGEYRILYRYLFKVSTITMFLNRIIDNLIYSSYLPVFFLICP